MRARFPCGCQPVTIDLAAAGRGDAGGAQSLLNKCAINLSHMHEISGRVVRGVHLVYPGLDSGWTVRAEGMIRSICNIGYISFPQTLPLLILGPLYRWTFSCYQLACPVPYQKNL